MLFATRLLNLSRVRLRSVPKLTQLLQTPESQIRVPWRTDLPVTAQSLIHRPHADGSGSTRRMNSRLPSTAYFACTCLCDLVSSKTEPKWREFLAFC
jgi:hypothetical protein